MPTDPPSITGTFMESRETRFHTGLDIRTAGSTGWPVLSPVDGWVSRVRCSARGYGLALYVATPDGRTLVFAHLDRFFDPAAELLREAQARTGLYEHDLEVSAGRIPVSAGQVVALSGETGTGAPHLHLEVRDAAQQPLNPADFLDVPDQVAPEVRAIRLVPADPAAPVPVVLEASGRTVAARGSWFVEVLAVDHTGFAPFPVAPRALTLYVDGTRRYRLGHDAVSFDESAQMRLDQRRDEGGRWYRLYRREGLTLPGREGSGEPLVVGARAVELFVVVEDASGLRGEFSAELRPEPADADVGAPQFGVEERLLLAEAPRRSELPPLLEGPDQHHLLDAVPGGWRLGLPHAGLADGTWKLLDRAELLVQRELRFPAGGLEGFAPEGAGVRLRETREAACHAGGALELVVVDVAAVDGLEPVGRGIGLQSHGFVPRASLEFESVGPATDHARIMRHDGHKWSVIEEDDGIGRTDGFGIVARMRDTRPPVIGEPRGGEVAADGARVLRRGGPSVSHGITLPAWPALEIPVSDEGCGLPDEGPELRLDDRPWPVLWDGERDRLLLDGFVELPPGRHRLTVLATDRAGRQTRRSWDVEFLP